MPGSAAGRYFNLTMKRLFKWALYLFIIMVALVVAAVLLLNTIAREFVQSRLRSETGMDVKIDKVDIGLSTPTISIEGLKLYNTPEFGGSPFLDVPEIFVEYDRDAMRGGRVHLKLLRINLEEIDLVQDKKGRLNIQGLEGQGKIAQAAMTYQTLGYSFTGIDTLNLTLQKLRVSNLDVPGQDQEVDFGLRNQVFHNLRSQADLTGMALVLAARGGMAAQSGKSQVSMPMLLQQLLR